MTPILRGMLWATALALFADRCAMHQIAQSGDAAASAARVDASSPQIVATPWSLVALQGGLVTVSAERARPTLVFDAEKKRVSGLAAVNRFAGSYTLEGRALKFGPLMATKMAGPPDLNELETRYLRALERTTAWRIDGGELELLIEDRVLARFRPKPDEDREGR